MPIFQTDIALRWADMDSLGHVNNATTLTLLEEGRVRLFNDVGQGMDEEFGLVVARHEIDYAQPMYYSLEPLRMSAYRYGLNAPTSAVRAKTVVVAITPDGSGSTPLPDSARQALSRYAIA